MKKFCRECGKELNKEHNVCIHCGTPLNKDNPLEEVLVNKVPMTKKKKFVWGTVIGLFIILISSHMLAKSYFSAESVQKRFENAITDNDIKRLTDFVIHENGSSISKEEAKAFAKLINKNDKNYLDELTEVIHNDTFVGIYDTYKIEVVDQYAYYDNFIDGLSIEFNGEETPTYEQDEAHITYGPLAPGIYTIKAKFSGDYGETVMEDTLTLDRSYREETSIGMDIPISMVSFYVENYTRFDVSEAYIKLNEEKMPIPEDGETEGFGPFIIDGSQTINIVAQMPWGEITSEDISIDESYMSINAELINSDQYKAVTETLKDFGEQYVNAFADRSTKPFTTATNSFKEDLESMFDDRYYFTGKLVKLQVEKDSIKVNNTLKTPEISIYANYTIESDQHSLTEKPHLEENNNPWIVSLSYDKENKEWLINNTEHSYNWITYGPTDVIEGSNKLHGPSEEVVKAEKTKSIEEEIENRLIDYTVAYVEAINSRDFFYAESYMTQNGPRRKEAEDYIDYLDSVDIYEDLYGVELEKLEQINDTTWKATILEEYEIIKPDTSSVQKFRTILNIKMIDGEYFIDELLETNPI